MNTIQYLIFLYNVVNSLQTESSTLEFVHIIFRHGARTPEIKDTYPTDPYKADAFLPMGYGELTKLGKRQEYELGRMLRQRYNEFLGDLFYPEMVLARSTDYSRTKMSAQLVLAGLFPPSESEIWNEQLPWQPIPVAYEKFNEDTLLVRAHHFCPKYVQQYNEAQNATEVQTFLRNHKDSIEYMSNHTGMKIETIYDGFFLYQTLLAEDKMNLTLPEWTKKVYPEILSKFALERCILENFTPDMKKLQGGRIWQQILKNMISKSKNELQPERRKIILYSGHDYVVYNTLVALNLTEPHFPEYSAAVIIELHRIEGDEYGIKVLYSRSRESEIEVLKLKNCKEICPLKDFLTLTKPLIPGNYTAECESNIDLDSRLR